MILRGHDHVHHCSDEKQSVRRNDGVKINPLTDLNTVGLHATERLLGQQGKQNRYLSRCSGLVCLTTGSSPVSPGRQDG